MTRQQFEDFITAVVLAANDCDLDREVFRKTLADPECSHNLYDCLHAGADAVAVSRLMAAVDAMNADPARTQPAGTLFTEA